ncbi:nicotinamide-nucleotide amidase [Haloferula luteola]|uniref:CinA-like protein n=1 Tax=Haloferula luteola TaxID=595692 RepID=A0A840UWM9_9BACT|nr:nicotinamide-nucleotide amidase [Haloferula luteola]
MNIEILNTGSELLLGTRLNTHGQWMGQELFKLGLRVSRLVTVPDGEAIHGALDEAVRRADVVLVTGGLGPTSDDITREAAAGVAGIELIEDEAALRSLEAFFAQRGRPMAPDNRKQAQVPVGAEVLPNPHGTAPGIYIPPRLNQAANCAVFLLPGPPRELYPMWAAEVVPKLRALSGGGFRSEMRQMTFAGVGESDLHQEVDTDLAQIEGLEVGYCARLGEVDVRLIGSQEAIDVGRARVMQSFSQQCFSEAGESLEEVVVKAMRVAGLKLATAESCTGGLIASRVTDVPGASAVLTHGWVTYANEAKMAELGVPAEVLAEHGAVSEAVAAAMAEGALKASGADLAVAVTGIAGPEGGSEEKPVGTVFLGVAEQGKAPRVVRQMHPRDRRGFKRMVSQSALDLIRQAVAKHEESNLIADSP